MQVELDPEQSQLQDSLRKLLAAESTHQQRMEIARSKSGWSEDLWNKMRALGAMSLTLPAAYGGFEQRPVAFLAVMPELGRALSTEPYLAYALASTLALHAPFSQARPLLETDELLTWAHGEAKARHDPFWLETTARRSGSDCILDGTKINVLHGGSARQIVVTAKGEAGKPELFLVQTEAKGVFLESRRLIDGTPVGTLRLQGAASLRLDMESEKSGQAIRQALQVGTALVCAEAIGVCERALSLTLDYVRLRKQFSHALAENQAVRHRLAEMQVSLDMVRSAGLGALLALEEDDDRVRQAELSKAKMLVSKHATFIAQQAIQLHGGVGMTLECNVGHCLRRITVIDQLFGDGKTHAAALGRLLMKSRTNHLREEPAWTCN